MTLMKNESKFKNKLSDLGRKEYEEKKSREGKMLSTENNEQLFKDLEDYYNVKNSVETLYYDRPEKNADIAEKITDLQKLNSRRSAFIESYNNLRTIEGQQKFKSDIEGFKSYLFADIPEGLTKRSATLAYYKKKGEQLRKELDKSNEAPSNLSSSAVINTPVVTQPIAPIQTPVQQAAQEEPVQANPFQYFPPDPIETESTPTERTEEDEINNFASILNNLGVENNMVVGSDIELTDEQLIKVGEQLRLGARAIKAIIKRDNPLLTPTEVINRIIEKVNKVAPLTEQKYNLLLDALNTEVAGGRRNDRLTKSYDEFFAEKEPEATGVDIVGNQNNKTDKVIAVDGAEYGHDKNINPAFSLAYLSHEYTTQDGKLQSTGKLAENENNQALLTSNEAFTQAGSIVANAQIDLSTPINEKLLDFKIEVTLQDKGQTVKTSLHDPRWIIEITDKNGNSLLTNPQLEILVDLAKKKDSKAIVNFLSRPEFTGGNTNKFRNTGGESVAEVVDHFVKLVQLRQQFLNIQDKSAQVPVTITNISPGKISFNKEFKSSKDTLPDKSLKFAIVGKNGELMATSTLNHSQNENVLGNTDYLLSLSGSVVVLIPTRKGDKIIPIGVRTNKISNNSQEQDLFYGGIVEFLSPNSKKIKIGNNTLDLSKTKDVKKFMSIYSTYMSNISALDASRHVGQVLIDFSDATDTRGKAIKLVIPDVIVSDSNTAESLFIRNTADLEKTLFNLAAESKLKVNSITITKEGISIPINENTKVKDLIWSYPLGKKMSIEAAIGDDSLLERPVQIPQFVRNTQTSKLDELPEKATYTEHIKSRTSSNVNGTIQDPLNKDKNVYFEQPIYEFAVDTTKNEKVAENKNKEVIKEETKPTEVQENNQEQIITVEDPTMTADSLFDDLISVDNTFEQSRQNDVNKQNGEC
jgi:hypothetical protein